MIKLFRCIAFIISAVLLIVGCSTNNYKISPEDMCNKTWVLSSINGNNPTDYVRVTIKLSPENTKQGRVSGRGYCNCYFGGYKVENKLLSFTQMGSTMMSCSNFFMQEERNYLIGLETANQITMKNNNLILKDTNNSICLIYKLESREVLGRVQPIKGGFPAGSTVIAQLINKNKTDLRYATIGMEIIKLKEYVPGSIKFSIKYAPHLVQKEHSYGINIDVMNQGKLFYTNSLNNTINLSYTPTQTPNDINNDRSKKDKIMISSKNNSGKYY